jgi:stage V sporulation protein G
MNGNGGSASPQGKEQAVKITEVRIKLVEDLITSSERLLAFCSVVLDDEFVVHDLKIIDGTHGIFVAMPSRKRTRHCVCGCKNPLNAGFCNRCGCPLEEVQVERDDSGRTKMHADIAHPTRRRAREALEQAVIRAYWDEMALYAQPGYVSRYQVNGSSD